MHIIEPTKRTPRNAAIKAVLAVACAVGLVVSAGLNEAEAAKGGKSGGTWEATKAPASKVGSGTWSAHPKAGPVVRDHRGEPPVGKPGPRPGKYQCGYFPNTPGCRPIVRDHRGPVYQKHKGVWSRCTRSPGGGLSCTPVSAQGAPPGPPSPGKTQQK
jgi:hypothetical protein